MTDSFNPFRLPLKKSWLASFGEKLLGLTRLVQYYDARPKLDPNKDNVSARFLEYTLSVLDINVCLKNEDRLANIPTTGPLILVANHPLGGLEGVAMSEFLLKIRPDLKVLTNQLLTRIPELSELFIGVDVLSKDAQKDNAAGIRAVCKHLGQGGALLIYPAGTVASIDKKTWTIKDSSWNTLVGHLAKRYNAHCVPFYVEGRNSRLFYLLGLIHKRLRTLMLARELANKQGKTLNIYAGQTIAPNECKLLEDSTAITNYLRVSTDMVAVDARKNSNSHPKSTTLSSPQPIAEINNRSEVERDLANLSEYKLMSVKDFSIYCAPYDKLKSVMHEIAKEREITFRAAGEGTGKSLDIDKFDPHYLHLFAWDDQAKKIVGGYRIGRTDEIVKNKGIKYLYSRSLYRFNEHYLSRMGKSLELGRSFITLDYQRHPQALDALWKGIGAYIAQNPEYYTLFGCVSISKENSLLAQAFLSDSMMESFRAEQEFLNDVRPIVPLKVRGKVWTAEILSTLGNISIINKLLGRCDPGKSIPVLLRHYLMLNGRFVGFSVNKGFNASLDGLILVDLRKTPAKYLRRYLGKEGSQRFLDTWATSEQEEAA